MIKKTVLILGREGMAGHMVFDYLSSLKKYNVFGTTKSELNAESDAIKIEEILKRYEPGYMINCIGIINKYADKDPAITIKVNGVFPHLLAYLCLKNNWKLVHLSTDCYLDDDVYGKSKFLGEVNDRQNLTVRTSIIGPELKNGQGLFHWFMSQQDEVHGFTKAYWDGVTTLQLAKFIEDYIDSGNSTGVIDYRTQASISKHDLIKLISEVFNKSIRIIRDDRETKDKRNKNPNFWCQKDYRTQLIELRNFMQSNPKYKNYLQDL